MPFFFSFATRLTRIHIHHTHIITAQPCRSFSSVLRQQSQIVTPPTQPAPSPLNKSVVPVAPSPPTISPKGFAHFFLPFMKFCCFHTQLRAESLTDMFCTDEPTRRWRFRVLYVLTSLRTNSHMWIYAQANELSVLPSMSGIFPISDWQEREIYDMFGVWFEGHPDMRRILTQYGFQGHPLRKDFPTTGFTETLYHNQTRRLLSRNLVVLMQVMR